MPKRRAIPGRRGRRGRGCFAVDARVGGGNEMVWADTMFGSRATTSAEADPPPLAKDDKISLLPADVGDDVESDECGEGQGKHDCDGVDVEAEAVLGGDFGCVETGCHG